MKRLLILLFAASSLTAVGQVPDYLVPSNPVMYFDFDGNAIEGVNGDEPLLPSGDIEYVDSGGRQVLELNGSAAHLYHPDSNFPSFETVSMCIEVRLDEFGSGFSGNLVPILSKWESTGTQNNEWFVFETDGQIWLWWTDSFNPSRDISFSHNWAAGEWHTICFEVGSRAALWIDGEFVEETIRDEFGSSNRLFRIGDWLNFESPNHRSLNGAIDRLAIWSSLLTDETSEAFHLGEVAVPGCTNPEACNYDDNANQEDGSCVACEVATAFCGEGTAWDPETQTCIVANPADTNLDGCVQLNDLLDLLSAYGDCGVEESPWQCGDPLEYQGYDYETVQIGEQCWFAENLRATSFNEGTTIVELVENEEWASASQPAYAMYPLNDSYGAYYNGYVILDTRSICPTGWRIGNDNDWMSLESFLGLEEVDSWCSRGDDEGRLLKSADYAGWNGTDDTGFGAIPSAYRYVNGAFQGQNIRFNAWSPGEASPLIRRRLDADNDQINRDASECDNINILHGFSIRCIQNAE